MMDDYSVKYLHHTESAILIDDCGNEIWIPLQYVEHNEDLDLLDRYTWITIELPDWIAEDKGLA